MSKCKPATKKELAWCERLRKVLAAHPKGIWLFNDGEMNIMKTPPDGETNYPNGCVNSENIIMDISSDIILSKGGAF